ncbi:hypothetical protein [Thioalkalivibrio sp.]|uniref:hypothetical protein n=1 Tax=Thioalkalivibrio sp. TaxID=2093813 RepID=UPI003565F41D
MTKLNKLSALAALAIAGTMTATANLSAAPDTDVSLDPCLNGGASTSGRFPTQSMEDEFNRYLEWVSESGLGVEHALADPTRPVHTLEPGMDANVSASGRFPSQAMEDQYQAYMNWVENAGLDPLHAFRGVSAN